MNSTETKTYTATDDIVAEGMCEMSEGGITEIPRTAGSIADNPYADGLGWAYLILKGDEVVNARFARKGDEVEVTYTEGMSSQPQRYVVKADREVRVLVSAGHY